jgi:hypothetical protein
MSETPLESETLPVTPTQSQTPEQTATPPKTQTAPLTATSVPQTATESPLLSAVVSTELATEVTESPTYSDHESESAEVLATVPESTAADSKDLPDPGKESADISIALIISLVVVALVIASVVVFALLKCKKPRIAFQPSMDVSDYEDPENYLPEQVAQGPDLLCIAQL